MSAKHTPGPWDFVPSKLAIVGGGGKIIALLVRPGCLKTDVVRTDADLRLIAAAPDLLDACEMLIENLRQFTRFADGTDGVVMGLAAIDKARGQS